jgi:hypothetical protein
VPFKDNGKLGGQYATTFCGNCHTYTDQNRAHKDHEGRSNLYCYSCHIVVPHGGKLGRLIADRNNMIAEGAGAAPVAAALHGMAGTGKVACIVTGGNIDAKKLRVILDGHVP